MYIKFILATDRKSHRVNKNDHHVLEAKQISSQHREETRGEH